MGVNLPVYPLKGHLVSASPAPDQSMVSRNIYRYIYTIYCDIYTIHCNIYTIQCNIRTIYCHIYTIYPQPPARPAQPAGAPHPASVRRRAGGGPGEDQSQRGIRSRDHISHL